MPKGKVLSVVLPILLLAGCATTPENSDPGANPDPYEAYNRPMYQFNSDFQNAFLRPLTNVYDYTPFGVRRGVHNFFGNLMTVPAILNDALQFNFHYMFRDMARLVINTTLGVGGIFDVAAQDGIYRHPQSFGYTLSKWGWRNSAYLELPFFGPSTVSGAVGMVPGYFANPIFYVNPPVAKYGMTGLWTLQTTSELLPQQDALKAMSLDPYIALRDAYLQNRRHIMLQIDYDGSPPPQKAVAAPPAPVATDVLAYTDQTQRKMEVKAKIKQQAAAVQAPTEVSPAMVHTTPVAATAT